MNEKIITDAVFYAHTIVNALGCLNEAAEMKRVLFDSDSEEANNTYQKAPHFFLTAYRAMNYRFLMEVAKLFDPDTKAINFNTFKNRICGSQILPKKYSDEYKARKRDTEKDIASVIEIRNKYLAHTDKTVYTDIETVMEQNPFSFERLRDLLYYMLGLCNRVIIVHTEYGSPSLIGDLNSDDFVRLLDMDTKSDLFKKQIFGANKEGS